MAGRCPPALHGGLCMPKTGRQAWEPCTPGPGKEGMRSGLGQGSGSKPFPPHLNLPLDELKGLVAIRGLEATVTKQYSVCVQVASFQFLSDIGRFLSSPHWDHPATSWPPLVPKPRFCPSNPDVPTERPSGKIWLPDVF